VRKPGVRPGGRPGGRPGAGRNDRPERPQRPEPRNEAERRAAEVRKTRAPRAPVDPDVERQKIEGRETEQWIDEGSIRAEAEAATARAAAAGAKRRETAPEVDPEVLAAIHSSAATPRRAAYLIERFGSASAALDRERFDDARRMVAPVVRELPRLAAGHELSGLASYRLGRWREAIEALEQARHLDPDPSVLPVLADCHRALRHWKDVESVWAQIKRASPGHEVMAEGRIVVAGAHADRGELREAIALLGEAQKAPKKVREYHLRQWYVLADLLDRAGDTVGAARWFNVVLHHDPAFADARDRVRSLGR
jgi:tetratricopeptide (TPR) repeat protein